MESRNSTVLLAYRHLYQHLLRAVQYSKPARYVARDRLRDAFRKSNQQDFRRADIEKTLEFLEGAAEYRGLEHRILKNLMYVWWTRGPSGDISPGKKEDAEIRRSAYKAFDKTIQQLNETMGLCIK